MICLFCLQDRAFNDKRYYIGSQKLQALGWEQRVPWEEGLKRTMDWYLSNDCQQYWQGDLDLALRPHPVVAATSIGNNSFLVN
jgi:UDP-glucose 4,6-dehydratase